MARILKKIFNILENPLFIFACMILGILTGFFYKDLAVKFLPFANFYANLLQIAVIPIVGITTLTSLTKLITHGTSDAYISKIVAVFGSMIVITAVVAVFAGYVASPGKNMSSDPNIVKIVEDGGGNQVREISLDEPIEKVQTVSVLDFIVDTVPKNIFTALAHANMLQIIVFCILLGITSGFVSRKDKKDRIMGLEDYLPVFYKINEKILLFLPLGAFCLLATQLSNTSSTILSTILSLALVMLSVMITLTIICSIVLWRFSGKSYFETIKGISETLIMAFSTQSSITCIPRAVRNMTENLGFDQDTVSLTLPLSVPLCLFSTICFYAIGTIFVVNIFNESLGLSSYIFIVFATLLTSFAASGSKGLVYYSLMGGILAPLGLPLGGTIALFVAVDPLVDPFGTVFHMYAACCGSAICCHLKKKEGKKERASETKESPPPPSLPDKT
ncbi:sodium:dicarboxylate symporter [Alphaproteobacteria bacterium]|nr:sodium:dicarboxylate symporter [Alphaproteobacteria bacterium]GHS96850.1 sodium:dicarboxylate symporter [Alphaproteobacteria bacterium]